MTWSMTKCVDNIKAYMYGIIISLNWELALIFALLQISQAR